MKHEIDVMQHEKARIDNKMAHKESASSNYRYKIAKEILDTEVTFVLSIKLLIQVLLNVFHVLLTFIEEFLVPLREEPKTQVDIEKVFGNVEEIAVVNSELLKLLTTKMDNWNNSSTTIGDAFVQMLPKMKLPYAKYTGEYPHAVHVLKQCVQSQAFHSWEQVSDCS